MDEEEEREVVAEVLVVHVLDVMEGEQHIEPLVQSMGEEQV